MEELWLIAGGALPPRPLRFSHVELEPAIEGQRRYYEDTKTLDG
jgi:hypothetical protein